MSWGNTFSLNKQPRVQIDHHKCNIEKIIYWISYIQPLTLWLFVLWGFSHGCLWLFKKDANKGLFLYKKNWKLEGFSQKNNKIVKFTLEKHMFSKSLPILGFKKSFIVKLFQERRVFLYAISTHCYPIEINANILMPRLRRSWQQRISIVINMVARDYGLKEGKIKISELLVPIMSKI